MGIKRLLLYFVLIIVGFIAGALFTHCVEYVEDLALAMDHEHHENVIIQLETDLDSCEDAWHTDVTECNMECDEKLEELQTELDYCNAYLEIMPD